MKVCFVGLGSIGTRHCKNLAAVCAERGLPLELHAVRSGKGKPQDDVGGIKLHNIFSYDEMDDDYDVIFITNPTSLHYSTLMRLGGRARSFFIEKPVFENTDEDVAALPFHEDTVCYVAAPLRYTAVLRKAGSILAAHRVYSARAISSSYLPDWRPGKDYRDTYSAHKALGGGVAIDLIHEWDYLTHFFGFPEKVYSLKGHYSHLEIDSDDLAVYIGEYPDKLAELHLDYFGRKTVRKLEAYTEAGTFVFDIQASKILYPDGTAETFDETINDRYLEEMRCFLSLIEQKGLNNPNTIEHAMKVLRITKGEAL